ncbi:hypothetical protein [Cellulomonas endometrii]|uniref:hypothetical protein n=1 Tax=Cellulomonas endometrii TaxID=3036301 RepID=UPI0024ADD9CE|nr:hypothetical protein [Cellulomonas endometrii]
MTSFSPDRYTFALLNAETRSRISIVVPDVDGRRSPRVEALTTLVDSHDLAERLADALNLASSSGDFTGVQRLMSEMLEPVAIAVMKAVERIAVPVPTGSADAAGRDDRDARVVVHVRGGRGRALAVRDDSRLQLVIVHELDDRGILMSAMLMSEDVELSHTSTPAWHVPHVEGALLERRYPGEHELLDAFSDPRWETLDSRAYWVWVQDEDGAGGATTEIVIEHWDRDIRHVGTYDDEVGVR